MSNFIERVLQLFENIHPLDRVPRAGYILRGVADPESVAAHSHFVSLMTLLFVDQFPEDFNKERALSLALVHDLAEARIMDIPMPYGDAYLRDAKRDAEQAIMEDLFEGLSPVYAELHKEFDQASTPEGKLLRGIDKAQMMLKILCYEREHRGRLEEFWINPKNFNDFGIEAVSQLFDEICKRAGKERPV